MFDLKVLAAVAKARHQDWQKEAERLRLLKQIRATNPRFSDRILINIGGLLISAGSKLQERYTPAMPRVPEAHQSVAT